MAALEINDVSFCYEKDVPVLNHISIAAGSGESIALVGANGAGKSTLLKLLVGLLPVDCGQISIYGLPVCKDNFPSIRQKVGYVFQDSDSQLFMSTAYEDIAFAPRNYGYSEEQVREMADHAMEITGCSHLRNKPVYKMSGGEKKLVSVATILALSPELIIMDEPSAALDPRNRKNLINLMNTIDCLKIIATHDLDMALDTCERTIIISNGRIAADGNSAKILTDTALLDECGLELPLRYG